MDWTPKQIAELTRLWSEHIPVRKIAKAMGATPNSIVGKAHRLQLERRASPIALGMCPGGVTKPKAIRLKAPEPKRRKLNDAPNHDPGFERRTAYYAGLGQNGRQCRFIHGHPGEPDSRVCTERAVKGRSWCPEHCATVFEWHQFMPKKNGEAA